MKILLTNDDGIEAEGLVALHKEIKKHGDILIVAPDAERSSVGHGITLSRPIFIKKYYKGNKFWGYGISGTPADCVKFAIKKLLKTKPDLVISGINHGPNDGCSVFYSGTIAAAREGALHGIPSIALSLDTFGNADFTYAARFTSHLIRNLDSISIPKGTFLNINVPSMQADKIKGLKFTQQGLKPIREVFKKKLNPHDREYFWLGAMAPLTPKHSKCDTAALKENFVTVTPIQVETTNFDYLNSLKNSCTLSLI